MRRAIALWVVTFLAVLITTACDPMTTVTFVNETQEKLNFYVQSDIEAALLGSGSAGPRASHEEWMIAADYAWLRVAATREDGQWVFDHKYTRDELEKLKRRVVVTSLEPIAPPANVRVLPSQNAPRPAVRRVTFVNETQEVMEFYTRSDVEAALTSAVSVGAQSSVEWGGVPASFLWLRIAATREDGEWVFDHTFGWDELEKAKRRVVVSSLQPIAPPADVNVLPSQGAARPVLPPTGTRAALGVTPAPTTTPFGTATLP